MSITNQPKLNFYKMDNNGYILNILDNDLELKKFSPFFSKASETLKKDFDNNIHSIYINKKKYLNERKIEVTFLQILVLTFSVQEVPKTLKKYCEDWSKELKIDVYISLDDVENFFWSNQSRFNLKTKYFCIYGDDVRKKILPFKPNWEIAFKYNFLEANFEEFINLIIKSDKSNIKKNCSRAMSILLAAAFEICMEREQKYSRDPYTFYKTFSKYYPEKEPVARKALLLHQKPSENIQEIFPIMSFWGQWILLNGNLLQVEKLLQS